MKRASPSCFCLAALPALRQGHAQPLQLEQLHRAGDRQAVRGAVQVRGQADLLLRQRGAAGQARRRRQGLRHPRADVQRDAVADQGRAAEADRQGEAAQPQEHQSGLHEHGVRPGQQVLGAVRDVDDDPGLQRREDEGAGPADRHVGGDLRPEVPREGEGPRHRARQLERALRRRAQVPGLLGQRHRREALEGGGRPHQDAPSPTGRRSTRRRTSRN